MVSFLIENLVPSRLELLPCVVWQDGLRAIADEISGSRKPQGGVLAYHAVVKKGERNNSFRIGNNVVWLERIFISAFQEEFGFLSCQPNVRLAGPVHSPCLCIPASRSLAHPKWRWLHHEFHRTGRMLLPP